MVHEAILLADLVEHRRVAAPATAFAARTARPSASAAAGRGAPASPRTRGDPGCAARCRPRSRSSRPGCSARAAASCSRPGAAMAALSRSCFRLWSTDSSRSPSASSRISMSVSRMMRNRCASSTSTLGNSSCRFWRITSSRKAKVGPVGGRQRHEPRQDVGNLDARELRPPVVPHRPPRSSCCDSRCAETDGRDRTRAVSAAEIRPT